MIFFAYIGFDAVSVAAQEARNPQRDMPIGILGSLLICTVLYILMSLTMTGLAPYTSLNVAYPVFVAINNAGPQLAWLGFLVNVGAVVGLASVVLVLLLGQSRVFYAMSRDGLIPPLYCRIHPTFRTPWIGTIVTGMFAGLLAGLVPLEHPGRAGFDRHAARVHDRMRRYSCLARRPAEHQAAVPDTLGLDRGAGRHGDVHLHDGVPAPRHVAAAGGLDHHRPRHLLHVWIAQRQAAAMGAEQATGRVTA